jgi:hypothetical protein
MAVPATCFNIVRGKVMRVTALDDCGAPFETSPPACEVAVTAGIISVAMTANVEAGEEIRDRNWAGDLCVVDRSPDLFIRWDLEWTFCQIDPAVASLLTGAALEMDGTEAVGFRTREGATLQNVAVELWTGTTPVVCGPGSDPVVGYTLLPFVSGGRIGDMTIQNGRADFVVSGAGTKSGAGWGVGPYDVIGDPAGPLDVAIQSDEHHLLRTTTVPPPTEFCGCETLEEAGGTRPS